MNKTVALVVDFQNDFIMPDGSLYVPGAENLRPLMTDYLDVHIEDFEAILFTLDTHYESTYFDSPEHKVHGFPIHCIGGTKGHKLALETVGFELIQDDLTTVLYGSKGVFDFWAEPNPTLTSSDIFRQTFLTRDSFFQYVKENDLTVEVSGVVSEICVKQAVKGLVERDIKTRIRGDLTQGLHMTIEDVVRQENWTNVEIVR